MNVRALATLGVLCATLVLAAPVQASYDPVASGTVNLTVDRGFARLLAANGVEIGVASGARRSGASLVLPAVGGRLDPSAERGEVESAGTLIFRHGSRRVKLRRIEVKAKPEPLVAKVGGSQLKVATADRRSFERVGFGSAIAARSLRLTAKFATRLGKKLRLRNVFEAGQRLGSLRSLGEPGTLAVLPVGRATFAPDPGFLAELESHFVSLNPIAPVERAPGPSFTLPLIPQGTISPDGAMGTPRTGGSLEFLQLGSGQVFWQELWFDLAARQILAEVDVQPSPTLPGKVGQVPVAVLGAGAVTVEPAARTVTIAGAPLALSDQGAGYFNQAFGTTAFAGGDPLGSLSFAASTQ